MKTPQLIILSLLATWLGLMESRASVVVQYGPTNDYVTNNVNFQTSSGSGSTSYTFSRTYDTASAWLASGGSYTGPAIYGGYYQGLTNNATFTPVSALGQIRNNEATSGTNDVIRFQSMFATASGIQSATQNFAVAFATGGSYSMDSSSALNWNARAAANPSGTSAMRFLLVADGTTYLSSSSFTWNNTSTNYSLTNPSAINWAAWTPGATMSFDSLTYDTLGSSLANIAFAGFAINQSTTAAGQNLATLDTQSFSADLVPEPSTWMLLGFGAVAVALFYRRRSAN